MATKQPADRSHFILPDLGEGVHEAELIKWRVEPGQVVKEHDILAEMETDKALVEVPSPWAGKIKDLNGKEGEIMLVGNPLVTYDIGDAPKGDAVAVDGGTSNGAPKSPEAAAEEREDAGTVVGSVDGTLSVSDRFKRRDHAAEAVTSGAKALATPAVRRVARELGVDINRVPATGRGGRVTASDVHNFSSGAGGGSGTATMARPTMPAAPAMSAPTIAVDADGTSERIPFRGVRRKIAEALHHSVSTAVHFTVVDEADVTTLDGKRREYAKVLGQKLSFLPFVMTAVCRALRMHPELNAIVDDANGEILRKGVIHLGCAVDTDHGLMVPVLRDADRLGLAELSAGVADVAKGCRTRTIERERLSGSTFTISNVGSYGGRFATPIINYPEVAILAVGRAREQVLTRDGMFYAGRVMPLSLSCDHRVVDGAEGARFLNTVVGLLQDPASLLGA